MNPSLHVVMYHYVRDLPRTEFPRLKGMLTEEFRSQTLDLRRQFEMATLESAIAFLNGEYQSRRDLCLMTFDDGLKEHYADVTPFLAQNGIQGVFFVITSSIENHRVAPVHMNHFLMARLPFAEYSRLFLEACGSGVETVNDASAAAAYPWDFAEIARFKFFFNFVIDPDIRDRIVSDLFERYISSQEHFASELYFNWDEARAMQDAGMVIGGHSHAHQPLSSLSRAQLCADLRNCRRLLDANLASQRYWPFCYPYGKYSSFTDEAVELLRNLNFACSFTTEKSVNTPGDRLFTLRRVDCKQVRG